jgi:hypothetical protein
MGIYKKNNRIYVTVIEGTKRKVIVNRRSSWSETVRSREYRGLVQAYGRVGGSFSRDVAKVVPGR